MADPLTIGAIGMGASAASGALGAFGSLTSGAANSAAYKYRAGVALINKQINETNAQWSTQAGDIAGEEKGLQAGQEIANTKVVQAASGNDVNSGTNEAVRQTQSTVAAFDQNVIRWDAAKTAYGYEAKATADQAEATLDYAAADQSKKAGFLGAIGSILSGASSVSSKWMQGNTIGIFGGK